MSRKKILVVDDSATALMITQALLRRGPYELLTATDGEQAVEVALVFRPDLILMDLVMPRMTGLEACERLRQHERTRHTPIILVTTRGEAENQLAGFERGCTDYVTKPIDGVELLSKVRACLGVLS